MAVCVCVSFLPPPHPLTCLQPGSFCYMHYIGEEKSMLELFESWQWQAGRAPLPVSKKGNGQAQVWGLHAWCMG